MLGMEWNGGKMERYSRVNDENGRLVVWEVEV